MLMDDVVAAKFIAPVSLTDSLATTGAMMLFNKFIRYKHAQCLPGLKVKEHNLAATTSSISNDFGKEHDWSL